MGHREKGVSRPVHWRLAAYVRYLNEDVQHIQLCHFVFPKFLDIEWCNLHGGCRERKDSEENNITGTLSSLSVCASMHRHVWYVCKCVGQATVCLPGELYKPFTSSHFPRNPTTWALTRLRSMKDTPMWLSDRLKSWQMITEPMK